MNKPENKKHAGERLYSIIKSAIHAAGYNLSSNKLPLKSGLNDQSNLFKVCTGKRVLRSPKPLYELVTLLKLTPSIVFSLYNKVAGTHFVPEDIYTAFETHPIQLSKLANQINQQKLTDQNIERIIAFAMLLTENKEQTK